MISQDAMRCASMLFHLIAISLPAQVCNVFPLEAFEVAIPELVMGDNRVSASII